MEVRGQKIKVIPSSLVSLRPVWLRESLSKKVPSVKLGQGWGSPYDIPDGLARHIDAVALTFLPNRRSQNVWSQLACLGGVRLVVSGAYLPPLTLRLLGVSLRVSIALPLTHWYSRRPARPS